MTTMEALERINAAPAEAAIIVNRVVRERDKAIEDYETYRQANEQQRLDIVALRARAEQAEAQRDAYLADREAIADRLQAALGQYDARGQELHKMAQIIGARNEDRLKLRRMLSEANQKVESIQVQRDAARGELIRLGSTLESWFEELCNPRAFPVDRALFIARKYGEAKRERDAAIAEREEASGNEQARWQEAIYARCCAACPSLNIDGGGCDSGDPLALTIAEIGQAINHWVDKLAEAEVWKEKLREEIDLLPAKLLEGGKCQAKVMVIWDGCSSRSRDTRALKLMIEEHLSALAQPPSVALEELLKKTWTEGWYAYGSYTGDCDKDWLASQTYRSLHPKGDA